MELLTISTHAHDSFTVIALAGELDLSTSPQLQQQVLLSRTRSPHLVFDLAGLTFMDTTGLRVIVNAHTHARHNNGSVAVAGLTGGPLRVLEVTGLHECLPVFATLDEALSAACAAPETHYLDAT
ncbi:MAG: anti-sigma factor antagonist [Streptosporangiaceae bacterium]|nr:anti-anti-sigma factor [Streptosporangiaceae bacterium]MDX6431678.1 anti-sigma factor antagonist [Streptosporangiaceae bacterium]